MTSAEKSGPTPQPGRKSESHPLNETAGAKAKSREGTDKHSLPVNYLRRTKAALRYARLGWAVFLVREKGKAPAGLEVPKGLQDASRDEAVIVKWWEAVYPTGNIGGVPPAGTFVLDIDVYANAALQELADRLLELNTPVQRSGSGKGYHVLFEGTAPSESELAARYGSGLQVKAHKRGYVLLAPSKHPTSGLLYEWIKPPTLKPLPMPAFVLDAPVREKRAADEGANAFRKRAPIPEASLATAKGIIDRLPDNWSEDYLGDGWLKVGMALHHQFEGADEALELWDEWSQRSAKYDADACAKKWQSFGQYKGNPVTLRSLSAAVEGLTSAEQAFVDHRASARELVIVGADQISPRGVVWLWAGRVPRKFITVAAGDTGSGKTTAIAEAVGRVTTGQPWPDDPLDIKRPPAYVLWLGVEDPLAEVTVPRLMAAGADLSRVKFIQGTRHVGAEGEDLFSIQDDLDLLRGTLRTMRDAGNEVALIVVDPVTAYLHGKKKVNLNVPTEFRAVLQPFATLCDHEDLAVICITHLTKDKTRGFIDSIMGSGALVHLSRAVWGFTRVPEEDDDSFAMFWGKGNLDAAGTALRYRIERRTVTNDDTGEVISTSRVVWGNEDSTLTKENLLGGTRGPVPFARNEIAAWLREYMSEATWYPAEQVRKAAMAAGFKDGSIRRTTDDLIKREHRERWNGVWMWSLPVSKT